METAVPFQPDNRLSRIEKALASARRISLEKVERAQTQLIEAGKIEDAERRRALEDGARALLAEANETLRNVRETETEVSFGTLITGETNDGNCH